MKNIYKQFYSLCFWTEMSKSSLSEQSGNIEPGVG